ncbi:MAG: putative lipid II flippase FtsW [Actinomycetota bacterium]|nr:putative lipid II flippase FtsW [Actinomycetota bacterium]
MKKGQFEARLLVLVTFALVAFGLVMVFSSTSASATLANGDPAYYLKRQAVYATLGLLLMFGFSRLDYNVLRAAAPALMLTSIGLLVAVLLIGQSVNGARRWITFGPAVFQPSELAKLALAVWAAGYLAKRRAPRTLKELWRPMGLVALLFCALLLVEPDLGTAITILVMLAGVLLISGTPVRPLAGGLAITAVVGLAAIWFEPYRRARLFSFINPWHDAQGAGYQTVQAMIGLGSGGLFGVGLGQSVQKANFLPEAHTDMIFAIIGEELGLVGAAVVIAAYATFAYVGLRIALRCRDPFGKRLAAGLTVVVCGQAAINLAAVMGLAPLTGIPLPFVSYGGSSLVVALVSVGILLNIAVGHAGERRVSIPDRSRRDGRPRAAVARRGGGAGRARRTGDVRRVAGSRRSSARS